MAVWLGIRPGASSCPDALVRKHRQREAKSSPANTLVTHVLAAFELDESCKEASSADFTVGPEGGNATFDSRATLALGARLAGSAGSETSDSPSQNRTMPQDRSA